MFDSYGKLTTQSASSSLKGPARKRSVPGVISGVSVLMHEAGQHGILMVIQN